MRRGTRWLGALLAVILLAAGACGAARDDSATTTSATGRNVPRHHPEVPALDDPAAASVTGALPQGELDEAAVADLAAQILDAQSSVTSWQATGFVSLELGLSADSGFAVPRIQLNDVPLGLITKVGDLVRVETDMLGVLAAGLVNPGDEARRDRADLPGLEILMGSNREVYVKLRSLVALSELDGSPPPRWIADLVAEHGDAADELWVLLDVSDRIDEEVLEGLGLQPQAIFDDFVELLRLSSAEGVLLEARSGDRTEVAGVEVQEYLFVLDVAAMVASPSLLQTLFGEEVGGPETLPDDFLGDLPDPVHLEFTVHIDEDYLIRRTSVDFDASGLLTAMFVESGDAPFLDRIESWFSAQLEVLAVNDPSLSVTLPDPSLVVEMP